MPARQMSTRASCPSRRGEAAKAALPALTATVCAQPPLSATIATGPAAAAASRRSSAGSNSVGKRQARDAPRQRLVTSTSTRLLRGGGGYEPRPRERLCLGASCGEPDTSPPRAAPPPAAPTAVAMHRRVERAGRALEQTWNYVAERSDDREGAYTSRRRCGRAAGRRAVVAPRVSPRRRHWCARARVPARELDDRVVRPPRPRPRSRKRATGSPTRAPSSSSALARARRTAGRTPLARSALPLRAVVVGQPQRRCRPCSRASRPSSAAARTQPLRGPRRSPPALGGSLERGRVAAARRLPAARREQAAVQGGDRTGRRRGPVGSPRTPCGVRAPAASREAERELAVARARPAAPPGSSKNSSSSASTIDDDDDASGRLPAVLARANGRRARRPRPPALRGGVNPVAVCVLVRAPSPPRAAAAPSAARGRRARCPRSRCTAARARCPTSAGPQREREREVSEREQPDARARAGARGLGALGAHALGAPPRRRPAAAARRPGALPLSLGSLSLSVVALSLAFSRCSLCA